MQKIIDNQGRIGVITAERAEGVFAKPEGVAYEISAEGGIPGDSGPGTATPWNAQPGLTKAGLFL